MRARCREFVAASLTVQLGRSPVIMAMIQCQRVLVALPAADAAALGCSFVHIPLPHAAIRTCVAVSLVNPAGMSNLYMCYNTGH